MISIYPNKKVSFESKYPVSDAIARLSAIVKDDDWRSRLLQVKEGILGSVKPERVILRYSHPWNEVSGWIWFEGSFKEKNSGSVLEGSFCLSKHSRVFMNSWLAVSIFLFCYSLLKFEFMAIPVLMITLWFSTVFVIWRWGKVDIEHISEVVNVTFNNVLSIL